MSRPTLARVRIVTNEPVDTRALALEFPSVAVTWSHIELVYASLLDADAWQNSTTFRPFDDMAEHARSDELVIRGETDLGHVACQVLTRYQRFIDRRNAASASATFDVVVRAHRAIHDERRSFGNGDLARALDTWQWLLRLDPEASLELQLVALFRDVERIEVETWSRTPRLALGPASDEGRALFGGERTLNILRAAGFDEELAGRVGRLVASDQHRRAASPRSTLEDAAGLSFLSLSSSGYLDAFGRDQARRRIASTLRRLSDAARAKLVHVRFRPDVFSVVREAA